jgi:pimeloyl-ACP methyl ester carboxylesterase
MGSGRLVAVLVLALLILTGCASRDRLVAAAEADGLLPTRFHGGTFILSAWQRPGAAPDGVVHIYIEGDGQAWLSRSQPSSDPTPRHPVALELALADHRPGTAVIARPCQYQGRSDPNCEVAYWTSARFAPPVIDATDQAVRQAMAAAGAHRAILVGYSGGGVVAALVAARRPAAMTLVTLAAPLDIDAWADHHGINRLSRSQAPLADPAALGVVRQLHVWGERDPVVPPALGIAAMGRLKGACAASAVIPAFDHQCCWADLDWQAILDGLACP